jgi:hypothetical protein
VMFANNENPSVERTTVDPVTLQPTTKPSPPRVSARVQPLPGGVMLGGGTNF